MSETYTTFDDLLDDVLARNRCGESPDMDSLCRQYPQFADDIRELLPSILLMEDVKPARLEAARPDEVLPKRIAGYRILRQIGQGGMGVVYEAEHESLRRRAALKVLSVRLADNDEAAERFRREGRAIAKLHHTNIVPLFEVGEDKGRLFLAMQLISGRSLTEIIRQLRDGSPLTDQEWSAAQESFLHTKTDGSESHSGLSLQQNLVDGSSSRSALSGSSHSSRKRFFHAVARIGLQAADALHYAHSRGIIHRDVKPSNLLMDRNGVVWLTDFGLAKIEDDDLTRTGDFVGTLRYMSPERFNGQCDHRSDIYSVGLTLYELLARRPAFESSDHVSLIRMIANDDPDRLRAVDSRIPRDLETIVLKSMDRDPKSRYRTARALAEDLQRYLHDQPIKARRHSIPERLIRWSRRNRSVASAIAAVAAMAVVTIVVLGVSLATARRATMEARRFASQTLLTQADSAFDDRRFQSASVLASASLDLDPSDAARAKLQSALASMPVTLRWTSPTFSDVTAMAGRADGRYLAAASGSQQGICVWDANALAIDRMLHGHKEAVHALAAHPTADRLLSGSRDQTVRLWNLDTGETRWEHSISTTPASLAIDPTGRYAAAGGVFRGNVWIWDCDSGRQVYRFKGRGSSARSIAFDRQATTLAAGFENGEIHFWDLPSGQSEVIRASAQVNSIQFFSDGRLAAATNSGVFVWVPGEGSLQPIDASNQALTSTASVIVISPDGDELVAGFESGEVRYFESKTLEEKRRRRLRLHNPLLHLSYHPDGRRLVVATSNEGGRGADRSIRLIDRQTGSVTSWTVGHVGIITQCSFNADGSRAVSCADDGTLRVWDARDGAVIARLSGHGGANRCAAIDRPGRIVASGAADKTIRIWNVDDGQPFCASEQTNAPVSGVAFHPQGNLLAVSSPTEISIWELDRDTRQLRSLSGSIRLKDTNAAFAGRTLQFGPCGKLLACGTSRGKVKIWSAQSREPVADFRPDENRAIRGLQFTADGTKMAVLCHEYRVKLYDIRLPSQPKVVTQFDQRPIMSMSLSPDGQQLVTASFEQVVTLWSVTTGQPIARIEGHRGIEITLQFGPDGKSLATSSNAELRMWNLKTSNLRTIRGTTLAVDGYQWKDYYDMLFAAEFSSDENLMFIRGLWNGGYNAVLLNRATGGQHRFKGGYGGDIDPHDRWLAVNTKSGAMDLYALDSIRRFPLPHDGTAMKAVMFNCDGSLLAGIGPESVTIWDPEKQERLYSFKAHRRGIRNRLVFHPRSPNLLATGGDDARAYLWSVDRKKHERLRSFDGHSGMLGLLAFSADGTRLATCARGEDVAALLWNVESGDIVQRFKGHRVRINAVDVSPDGRWVATASNDDTVRLWDVGSGAEIRRFQDHTSHVYFVRFVDGGNQLVSASADGTIRFRELKPEVESEQIDHERLMSITGLHLRNDRIQPAPKRVEWHVNPDDVGQ